MLKLIKYARIFSRLILHLFIKKHVPEQLDIHNYMHGVSKKNPDKIAGAFMKKRFYYLAMVNFFVTDPAAES
jgi:hypothetical protein